MFLVLYSLTTKKLASCHVYGAHTRGKLLATCARHGGFGCCKMYNLPRVHAAHAEHAATRQPCGFNTRGTLTTWPTVSHVD
jgi:hypothetical protein